MVQVVQQTFGIEIAACHLIKGGEVDDGAYFIGLVVAFSGVFQAFAGTCDGRIGLEAVVEAEQLIVQSGFATVVATGYQGFAAVNFCLAEFLVLGGVIDYVVEGFKAYVCWNFPFSEDERGAESGGYYQQDQQNWIQFIHNVVMFARSWTGVDECKNIKNPKVKKILRALRGKGLVML